MSTKTTLKPFYPTEMPGKSYNTYKEVWDGVVIMSPMANNEHMRLVPALTRCLDDVIDTSAGDEVFPSCDVSDRNQGWQQANYRVPDNSSHASQWQRY